MKLHPGDLLQTKRGWFGLFEQKHHGSYPIYWSGFALVLGAKPTRTDNIILHIVVHTGQQGETLVDAHVITNYLEVVHP